MEKTIILIGPPGAGKGYYSHWLTTHFGFKRLASGDILRKYSNENSTLAEQIAIFLKDGHLIPDDLMSEMFFREITSASHKIVLDGYPRTVKQEKMYRHFRKEQKWEGKTLIISLICGRTVSDERVHNRAICSVCGASYHLKFAPPKRPGECDFDKNQLLVRNDAIKNEQRWEEFETKTVPLLKLFRNDSQNYVFYEINTEQSITKTKTALKKIL